MSDIGLLLCGQTKAAGTAKTALDQLSASINNFSARAINYLNGTDLEEARTFGPFCARVILENACAALVGRLDCFRLLYLTEFQEQPEYEPGRRAKSAFSWAGDVIPDDKAAPTLWSLDYDVPKISRALFSRHSDHVYWKPAVSAVLDHLSTSKSDAALSEILSLDPENYIHECKGKSLQLYSKLSKGVHWEFFTSTLLFDEITVKNSIREACVLVAQLGLISHFIPTAYAALHPSEAVEVYLSFRKVVP